MTGKDESGVFDVEMSKRDFLKNGGAALTFAALSGIPSVASSMSHLKSMSRDEIVRMSLSEGVEALNSGKLSSAEYNQACLKQYEKFREYNIFAQVSYHTIEEAGPTIDQKRSSGMKVGALQGAPYALKDSIDIIEYYTIAGHPSLRTFEPLVDADLVSVYKEADGVCLGKTQLPPLSAWYATENPMTGYTGNPFNIDFKTGGSSGGSGAAVAARIVPFAIGGDTGGSIRVPAAMNGVQGFRPSSGRWPAAGAIPICFADVLGPIARSVADIKLLDTISASDHPENRPSQVDLAQIRIGYQKDWFFADLHPWVEDNLEETMSALSAAGAELIEVDGMPAESCHQNIYLFAFSDLPGNIARYFSRHRVYDVSAFSLLHEFTTDSFKKLWLNGMKDSVSGEEYFKVVAVLMKDRETHGRIMAENEIDVFMYPTTKIPNMPSDGPDVMWAEGPLGKMLHESEMGGNMLFSPALRTPSLSMYSGMDKRGMPLGMTFDGYADQDRRLLDIAEAIEKVMPPVVEPESI